MAVALFSEWMGVDMVPSALFLHPGRMEKVRSDHRPWCDHRWYCDAAHRSHCRRGHESCVIVSCGVAFKGFGTKGGVVAPFRSRIKARGYLKNTLWAARGSFAPVFRCERPYRATGYARFSSLAWTRNTSRSLPIAFLRWPIDDRAGPLRNEDLDRAPVPVWATHERPDHVAHAGDR